MSRPRTKRKIKTRRSDPMAAFKVINRQKPLPAKEQLRLGIMARMALRDLTHGTGDVNALNEIIMLINVTTVLGEQVCQDCVDVCLPAVKYAKEAGERLKKHGRAGLNGEGIQQFTKVLDLYEQFVEHITPAQHEAAWTEVFRRLDARNLA